MRSVVPELAGEGVIVRLVMFGPNWICCRCWMRLRCCELAAGSEPPTVAW
jgi:hypothetical protein